MSGMRIRTNFLRLIVGLCLGVSLPVAPAPGNLPAPGSSFPETLPETLPGVWPKDVATLVHKSDLSILTIWLNERGPWLAPARVEELSRAMANRYRQDDRSLARMSAGELARVVAGLRSLGVHWPQRRDWVVAWLKVHPNASELPAGEVAELLEVLAREPGHLDEDHSAAILARDWWRDRWQNPSLLSQASAMELWRLIAVSGPWLKDRKPLQVMVQERWLNSSEQVSALQAAEVLGLDAALDPLGINSQDRAKLYHQWATSSPCLKTASAGELAQLLHRTETLQRFLGPWEPLGKTRQMLLTQAWTNYLNPDKLSKLLAKPGDQASALGLAALEGLDGAQRKQLLAVLLAQWMGSGDTSEQLDYRVLVQRGSLLAKLGLDSPTQARWWLHAVRQKLDWQNDPSPMLLPDLISISGLMEQQAEALEFRLSPLRGQLVEALAQRMLDPVCAYWLRGQWLLNWAHGLQAQPPSDIRLRVQQTVAGGHWPSDTVLAGWSYGELGQWQELARRWKVDEAQVQTLRVRWVQSGPGWRSMTLREQLWLLAELDAAGPGASAERNQLLRAMSPRLEDAAELLKLRPQDFAEVLPVLQQHGGKESLDRTRTNLARWFKDHAEADPEAFWAWVDNWMALGPEPAELVELVVKNLEPLRSRRNSGSEFAQWKHMAKRVATPAATGLLNQYVVDAQGQPRLKVADLLTWAHWHQGQLDGWQRQLDRRIAQAPAGGDVRAGWLLARAYAQAVVPTVPSPLRGVKYLREALGTATSQDLRLYVINWFVEGHLLNGQYEQANSMLAGLEPQFPEAREKFAYWRKLLVEHRQGVERLQASRDAQRHGQWKAEIQKRLAQAKVRQDSQEVSRLERLLAPSEKSNERGR